MLAGVSGLVYSSNRSHDKRLRLISVFKTGAEDAIQENEVRERKDKTDYYISVLVYSAMANS